MKWSKNVDYDPLGFVLDAVGETWTNNNANTTESEFSPASDTGWVEVVNQVVYDGSTQNENARIGLSANDTDDSGDYLALEPGQATRVNVGNGASIYYRSSANTTNILFREIKL